MTTTPTANHCPICGGTEGCDHTVIERERWKSDMMVYAVVGECRSIIEAFNEFGTEFDYGFNFQRLDAALSGDRMPIEEQER